MNLPFITRGLDAPTVSRLVERFLDGATTPAEEKAIYQYYATHPELPDWLEPYRDMFGWYAAMSPKRTRRSWRAVAAAVAAVIIVAGVGITMLISENSEERRLYASYEGSYIVHNGQRIDDIQAIYSRLASAEQYADSILSESDREAADFERNCEQSVIDQAFSAIDDPEVASALKKEMFQ